MAKILQGEILSVEHVSFPVIIVSKDFFNQSEQVIACPVQNDAAPDPLHIPIKTNGLDGIILCEQIRLLDLRTRGYKKLTEVSMDSVMNITDAIQGIFDYYPSH